MPELPEVETFVRQLQPACGSAIAEALVVDPKLGVDASSLSGRRIASIERRGKHIVFGFADGGHLVIHLRMSGRLRLDRSEEEIPYTRLILRLDSGESVYFINPRRLGTARVCRNGFDVPLGVEPLSDAFDVKSFNEMTRASRTPIKHLLMDQRKVSGIGNIYAAEALWRAGIDPRRPANSLDAGEVSALRSGIVATLREAIDELGTTLGRSVSDYRPSASNEGSFQNLLHVYGREGEACTRCEAKIERITQQGRTTYFCPSCQT
jgi:formamidopyrimidine-DNA glycosylase